MRILTKVILSLFLITTVSCVGINSREHNEQWMRDNLELITHPDYEGRSSLVLGSEYLKGFNKNPSRPKGMAGCYLSKLDPWKFNKYGSDGWSRHQSWKRANSGLTNEVEVGLDDGKEDSSAYITKRKAEDPKKSDYWGEFIYIGPWKFVPKIGKEIRLVATQGKIYGGIRSFFESKTPENSLIPEMPEIKLARSPEMNLDYCKVLWAKTYGYNAVADLKRNPWWPWFSRNFYRGTGKIIDATE